MIKIQLFSDGGVFCRNRVAVSAGIMCIDKKKILSYEKIMHNKNIDFIELFAINKMLSRAYGYCKQKEIADDCYIEIYTDSKTSIDLILARKNIDNIKSPRDQIIYEIIDTIEKFDNRVYFYHIKSHISGTKLKSSYIGFCRENDIEISFDDFLFIYQQNKKCDNKISKEYKKYHKRKKILESSQSASIPN